MEIAMKQFARIEDGYVVELLRAVELPPFHPSLVWVECGAEVEVGWQQNLGSLIQPEKPPEDPLLLVAAERVWRDATIESVKWLRERHRDEIDLDRETTLNAEQFIQLLGYMQDLRDWPQSDQFPAFAHRPVAPPWIAEQTP
ncbi:hypothetical protein HX782_28885 [Pseudomonas gingeri]|nr:hypothetical protein [Pseudomonas gingeri]NWA17693.1 hypothetical protein [Pseudomonas gingeri]NWA56899.1 hypothetical protein [Pseudomonas gingeri]NWA97235.1 hypothetical protein [Pseudomonas gingeri]NWB01713.1 hypothetical protein [Pseudomonas gingeri]